MLQTAAGLWIFESHDKELILKRIRGVEKDKLLKTGSGAVKVLAGEKEEPTALLDCGGAEKHREDFSSSVKKRVNQTFLQKLKGKERQQGQFFWKKIILMFPFFQTKLAFLFWIAHRKHSSNFFPQLHPSIKPRIPPPSILTLGP